MDNNTIVGSFDKYFYVARATTQALRETIYRIRYEVYCREFGYEREKDCPGQMERDVYDNRSIPCLLVHKPTDTPMGCVRLILPPEAGGDPPLPFERFCTSPFAYAALGFRARSRGGDADCPLAAPTSLRHLNSFALGAAPRGSFCEVSRLAVLSSFRRRRSDEKKPLSFPEDTDSAGRSSFPLIPVSLFLASLSLFMESQLHYAFAMMEPRLTRLLRRYGLIFTQVGDVVDYHGQRGPFVYTRGRALAYLTPEVYELYRLIDRQLSAPALRTEPRHSPALQVGCRAQNS